ncbi:MAG TPA: hypothetical protein DCX03_02095 [Bacteroidales bacterium]|jgi:competence ComEA-like helix-hairpin-helix protein|nr:hypothetical protein [Bacteroidales bacterium]
MKSNLPRFFKKYFTFSRRELRGVAVLLLLIGILLIVRYFLIKYSKPELILYDQNDFTKDSIEQLFAIENTKEISKTKPRKKNPELFEFNPNTLDEDGFKRLGLPQWTIQTIIKFRNSGGKFYKPEDFSRIYNLDTEDFERLKPFIRIPEMAEKKVDTAKGIIKKEKKYTETIPIIEINTADSTLLEKLPGIGPAYALRIIKYRQRLGGFVNTNQLLEVYGMDTVRLSKIKPFIRIDTAQIQRIDLNNATFKELLRHPYMEYYLVKAIVNYRDKNNGFRDVNELRRIDLIYDDLYYRIRPYFMVKPEYIPDQ